MSSRSRDETERIRLGLQHGVWQHATREGLQAAGFGPGQVVADLGCGAGHLAVAMEPRGRDARSVLCCAPASHGRSPQALVDCLL